MPLSFCLKKRKIRVSISLYSIIKMIMSDLSKLVLVRSRGSSHTESSRYAHTHSFYV
jgi:hypothetical protein